MAVECGNTIQICALRFTLLDTDGSVLDTEDNVYVSNKAIEIGWTPDIEAGRESTLEGACDCILGSFLGVDKLKRFLFALQRGAIEPALIAMAAGHNPIPDGDDVIGVAWADLSACGVLERKIAFEFWTKHWVDDEQDVDWPWWHHVYPGSVWQIGDNTFNSDLGPFVMNGKSRTNTQWGQGPYGDGPGVDIRRGAIFLTDVVPPTAECAYQHVEPGSGG